jgi:hypothetical protein
MVELEGRKARCDFYGGAMKYVDLYCKDHGPHEGKICRCEKPSSEELAFFEYRGKDSEYAKTHCKNCRQHKNFHTPDKIRANYGKICGWFVPYVEAPYDMFFCGCIGWD